MVASYTIQNTNCKCLQLLIERHFLPIKQKWLIYQMQHLNENKAKLWNIKGTVHSLWHSHLDKHENGVLWHVHQTVCIWTGREHCRMWSHVTIHFIFFCSMLTGWSCDWPCSIFTFTRFFLSISCDMGPADRCQWLITSILIWLTDDVAFLW